MHGVVHSICFLRENLLQMSWGKHKPRLFDNTSEIQADPGSCCSCFLSPSSLFSSSQAEIIISVHRGSKVNIPDINSASYHEATAKLLSDCFTIGFCLRTFWLNKAEMTRGKHLGRREQRTGQEVETRETGEMKRGMKDAVFNRSSWLIAKGTDSSTFQSEKPLVCTSVAAALCLCRA